MAFVVVAGKASLVPVPAHSGNGSTVVVDHLTGPALAALTVVRLGGEASLWSHRRHGEENEALAQFLDEAGVDVEQFRSLAARAGAGSKDSYTARTAQTTDDPPSAWLPVDRLNRAGGLYVDLGWPSGASRAAEAAGKADIPVVLDANIDSAEAWEIAKKATHVLVRADVAESAGGAPVIVQRLRESGVWAAVTLGHRGVYYSGGHMLPYRVAATKTEGAGDVLRGAFTLALAEGRSEFDALRFGQACAAMFLEKGVPPRRGDVLELMVDF